MRTLLRLFLAAGLGVTVGACFDDELTLNTECDVGDDCGPGQTCTRTMYQLSIGEFGWCRPDSSCAVGEQPGCECDAQMCTGSSLVGVASTCVSMTSAMELETCMTDNPSSLTDCVCVIRPAAT